MLKILPIHVNANNYTVDDGWTEVDAEIPAGITDTMLTAADFLEDSERAQIYSIAPGEGNRPLSLFRDIFCISRNIFTCRSKKA